MSTTDTPVIQTGAQLLQRTPNPAQQQPVPVDVFRDMLLSYDPTANIPAGRTTITLAQYLLNNSVANVKDFGAIGNGVANDTVAFNAAVTASAATGVPVYIPPTTTAYMVDASYIAGVSRLPIKSGVTIFGSGPASYVKVMPNLRASAVGIAPFYDHTAALTNVTFSNFTLDYNGQNNPYLVGYANAGGVNRLGGNGVCTNILVDNVWFKNSGGYHFLYWGGGVASSNVIIRNCHFNEWGQSVAGNQIPDFSGIYLDADKCEIAGNTFVNASVCEISTAIETHGAELDIHDNYVTNSETAYNLGADVRSARDIKFHDNTCKNIRFGVQIYTAASWALSHVKIHDNSFSVREPTGVYPAGAAVNGVAAFNASTVNVAFLEIQDNEFYQETTALLTGLTNAISLQRCDDVLISGNKIANFVGEAILLQAEATPRSMSRIKISDNDIKDVGITSTASNKRAIGLNAFNVAGQTISNLDIRGNTIVLSAAGGTVAVDGIKFNGGSFPETRIVGNTILGMSGLEINKLATIAGDVFYLEGEVGTIPYLNIRGTLGSRLVLRGSSPVRVFNYTAGTDGSNDGWRSVEWDSAAPVANRHNIGDLTYNNAPAVGGPVGWICTLGGTPGTHSPFGEIQNVYPSNGGKMIESVIEELVTLSTVGTTTDTVANLLLSNSENLGVTAFVTTTITTATDWSVGDSVTAARFIAATATLPAGTAKVGLQHRRGSITTDAAGPTQVSGAKIRITTTGIPGAGAIRLHSYNRQFIAPTS